MAANLVGKKWQISGRFSLCVSVKFSFLWSLSSLKHIHILCPCLYWVAHLLLTNLWDLPEHYVPHTLASMSHDTPSLVFCFSHSANGDFSHTLIFICSNLATLSFMEPMFFTLLEILLFHPTWYECSPLFPPTIYLCILFFKPRSLFRLTFIFTYNVG